MSYAIGIVIGAFGMLLAIQFLPEVFCWLKRKLGKLDNLHWSMAIGILILAAVGWWVAGQCSQARRDADQTRQRYFEHLKKERSP